MTVETFSKEKIEELFRGLPTYEAWKKVGTHKRFGVLMPLSQIRSRRNQGVGDFGDLPEFAKFCRSFGCSIIQILPINDMGKGETPYSSLSAFALDPVFIALDKVSELTAGSRSEETEKFFTDNAERISDLKKAKRIKFDGIRSYKLEAIRIAFNEFLKANKKTKGDSWKTFESFKKENEYWLEDYALFRTLKEKYCWDSWEKWAEEERDRHADSMKKLLKDNKNEVEFYSYIQWLAFTQLKEAHDACFAEGVLIKGDLPLLVDYQSADVWSHPEYFKREFCGGAPPDQYSFMGQNWGMPTYNWYKLSDDDFIWWRKRLQFAENFYDIFRIDHVVGLFRIWSIPITEEFPRGKKAGKNGRGHHKPTWEYQGRTLLSMMVESTKMLPIGEDLGTIPYVCRKTLSDLGIPGYKVIIWERDWNDDEHDMPFFKPEEYPYISMSTSTTHDFFTLPGWWIQKDTDPEKLEAAEELKTAFWHFLGGEGARPERYSDKLHKKIMEKLFYSSSIFLIMPFNDLWGVAFGMFGEDPALDRINDPDKPENPFNWTGKMPIEIDALSMHPVLITKFNHIKELVKLSGR
jgi:4-alpha-glucanotransferase